MIAAIVAVDENWGIGCDGKLLVSIPDDLKHFKEITSGHVVVMGKKTWESLPKKPLKDRINVIVSTQTPAILDTLSIRMNLEQATQYIQMPISEDMDYFIIGGGTVYEQFLPLCDRVYVTKIHKQFSNVDTYFPNLDNMPDWTPGCCSAVYKHDDLEYQFWEYDRVN